MSASQSSESAAGSLAEIRRRQGQVVEAVLVPAWYWWVVTAGMIAIGAAADSRNRVVLAVAIPVAVVVIAALTGGMIFGAYRGVRVNDSELLGGRGAGAIHPLASGGAGARTAVAFTLRAAA